MTKEELQASNDMMEKLIEEMYDYIKNLKCCGNCEHLEYQGKDCYIYFCNYAKGIKQILYPQICENWSCHNRSLKKKNEW